MNQDLIRKYNVPGPRYTSYPTVPYWDKSELDYNLWLESVRKTFNATNRQGISLYIHLPFCEDLCTFCGCHKRITKRHSVETPYIEAVLKEWKLYRELFSEAPRIKEIHLGGGTPTFFNAGNLKRLIEGILEQADLAAEFEFSFEAHPNHTSKDQLKTLFDLGFRRNSFGVQDYDPKVQKVINRIQPFENVQRVHEWSKEIGYTSISHDLVFGLPLQTMDNVKRTIELTNSLRPDRLAYYSYAHVPWIKGLGQRGYDENDLPKDEEKRALYEIGKQLFDENGYVEIGMDHFALESDNMYQAMIEEKLHRNFMGYTTNNTKLMIGLGMSSISDSWTGFAQNVKSVEEYESIVHNGKIPVFRGHLLNEEDLVIRQHILNIMCHFKTDWSDPAMQFEGLENVHARLEEMELDGLVKFSENGIELPEEARPYVRNVCMAFDLKLLRSKPTTRIFSMTI